MRSNDLGLWEILDLLINPFQDRKKLSKFLNAIPNPLYLGAFNNDKFIILKYKNITFYIFDSNLVW